MINEVVRDMSEDGTIGRLQNKWITEFARNRSLEYVFHQNEVFYITFILGIIIVLCITAGYWEVDRRQENISAPYWNIRKNCSSPMKRRNGPIRPKVSFSPICPTISAHRSTDHGYGGDHQEKSG